MERFYLEEPTINRKQEAIEYIEEQNGRKIEANGKSKITIDYILKKDEEKIIKIKEKGKEVQEEKILVIYKGDID